MPVIRRSHRIAVASFYVFLVAASTARSDAIDDDVRSAMDRQHIPGLALAVIRSGKPVKIKGYGSANIELNTPMTPDTVLKILDYFVLAEVIRRVSGEPWPDFLAARIFKPLGMRSTRTTSMTDVVPNRADGYLYRDNQFKRAEMILALRPSGALLSGVADLVKWDAAINAGAILPKTLLSQMWTPTKLNDGSTTHYGFGWSIDTYGGHRRVRHGGSLPGFRSEYVRFVDDRINVIVLANSDGARPDSIAVAVAGHFIPGLWPKRHSIKLDPSALAAYAGEYQIDPTNIATVAVDGSGLSVQFGSGGAQWRMVPDSANTFFIVEDEKYVFAQTDHGGMHLAIKLGDVEIAKADRLP